MPDHIGVDERAAHVRGLFALFPSLFANGRKSLYTHHARERERDVLIQICPNIIGIERSSLAQEEGAFVYKRLGFHLHRIMQRSLFCVARSLHRATTDKE